MTGDGGRRVHLVLCDADGTAIGALPAFEVGSPWWADVEPVVSAARDRLGTELVVLRLLWVEDDQASDGGEVTYLAEIGGTLPTSRHLLPIPARYQPDEDPLRMAWARPGGLRAIIEWGDARLAAIGRPRIDAARQIKTWNLSSVVALPTAGGVVWCKSVPPFLTDEGAVLGLVGSFDPSLVPPVLDASPELRTVLLEDVGANARWEASEAELLQMVVALTSLQIRWTARSGELLAAGLPDWGARALPSLARDLLGRPDVRATLGAGHLATLDALVADLPRRFAALAACGVPETLVHGDFHPGNWHAHEDRLILLDWGDSGLGHPFLDMSAFLERVPDERKARIRSAWIEAWRDEWPGSEPERAADLIEPVSALRRALIYRGFLDGIEPSERRYHERDVPDWLVTAARLTERTRDGGPG